MAACCNCKTEQPAEINARHICAPGLGRLLGPIPAGGHIGSDPLVNYRQLQCAQWELLGEKQKTTPHGVKGYPDNQTVLHSHSPRDIDATIKLNVFVTAMYRTASSSAASSMTLQATKGFDIDQATHDYVDAIDKAARF